MYTDRDDYSQPHEQCTPTEEQERVALYEERGDVLFEDEGAPRQCNELNDRNHHEVDPHGQEDNGDSSFTNRETDYDNCNEKNHPCDCHGEHDGEIFHPSESHHGSLTKPEEFSWHDCIYCTYERSSPAI